MPVAKSVGGNLGRITSQALLALVTFMAREVCADSNMPTPGGVTDSTDATAQKVETAGVLASSREPQKTSSGDGPEANAAPPPASTGNTGATVQARPTVAPPLILPRSTKRYRHWKRHDKTLEGIALRALGLRAVAGTVDPGSNGQSTDHPIGATLVERGLGLIDYGLLDARYLDEFQLGGDSKGWTYRADAQLSLGPRWRWTQTTSGVLRVGARAHIAQSGGVYSSDVRAPTLALGVRHASSTWHLDAAAEYAPVLTGFFEPPTTSYSVRGSQAGAAVLSFGWNNLHFDAEYTRYWRDDSPHSVNQGSAWGCAYLGWGLLCLDGRMQHIPSTEVSNHFFAVSAGVSALIGKYEWLHSD